MPLRKIRKLTVQQKRHISPNMLRLKMGGDELNDFPEQQESAYIKLLLPVEGRTVKRSYTIRQFNSAEQTLTLDFVIHGDQGPASMWAKQCQLGDEIHIDGPGATKRVDNSADWFFLAGDMTALPAISVNLEQLPASAKGYAVLEIMNEADKQHIDTAEGMQILWVLNPVPDQENSILVDAVKQLPWLTGRPSIWVASEFAAMRRLRHYFKKERGVQRDQIYASSYWKMGETDEGNKAAKKLDLEAD